MHKIFIAQKSYCARRVLSLATIRSKYYFNFILNRTRSGWELFDRPSYILLKKIPKINKPEGALESAYIRVVNG